MTIQEAKDYGYDVEPYGGGFILVDYSGKRGKFGAAYRGINDHWSSQPTVSDPFPTEGTAWDAAE